MFPMEFWGRNSSEGAENRDGISAKPMADIMASVQAVHDVPDNMPSEKGEASQSLAPHLDPIPIPEQQISILLK